MTFTGIEWDWIGEIRIFKKSLWEDENLTPLTGNLVHLCRPF